MADFHSILAAAGHGAVEAEHHVEPLFLGFLPPAGVVSVAMALFIAILLWKRVPTIIAKSLDGRIAQIRTQLDEASAIRAEAERLKAEYEAKMAAAATEAEELKARAERDAQAIVADAQADAQALIARRQKMAEEKIASAERAAVEEIRAKVTEISTQAAGALIAKKHDATADKALVDRTISSLGSRLN